jgi:demethylmenaquinone methyltransferase / 2-methoxy-6-polyprenyl-1,4-benzoquinol methylase
MRQKTSTKTRLRHEPDDTHFGYRSVPVVAKQDLVDDVFHKVAGRYDLMNDLMSLGLHRAWKDALVSSLRPRGRRAFALLDVAGGTGDIAFRVLDAAEPDARATVLDINGAMLGVGRERTPAALARRIDFVQANAEALPFAPARFDAYTIAFGIRNVPRISLALAEAYRVLGRGGRFLCLEFSQVDVPGLDRLYDGYSFAGGAGAWQAGDRRWPALSLSGRINPAVPQSRDIFANDPGRGFWPCQRPPDERGDRLSALRLEAVRHQGPC